MKYELTDTRNSAGLRQIRALRAGPWGPRDTLGGYVESENNLAQDGIAWVSGNAQVFGDALVFGDAWVSGNAQVFGDAWISGDAQVSGNALVFGNAQVFGDALVFGDAWVSGNAPAAPSRTKYVRHYEVDPLPLP